MKYELPKCLNASQRFKYGAMQFVGKVQLTLGSISETQPDSVAGDMPSFNDMRQHGGQSSGSMRGNGRLARANDQA